MRWLERLLLLLEGPILWAFAAVGWLWRRRCRVIGVLILAMAGAAGAVTYHYVWYHKAEAFFEHPPKQFRYGSTGGDRLVGIPVGVFDALPKLCRDYLPGDGWQSLGFIVEPKDEMKRPVGTSKRYSLGFDRISLNCGTCHTGTYRMSVADSPTIVDGMPANRLDLGRFTKFLTQCALDERFNPWQVIQAAEESGARYSFFDRLLLQYVGVPAMKEFLILAQHRFRFLAYQPEPGPGRFDTFGPEKALLNWNLDKLPERERVGIVDFPSLWLQGPREKRKMWLHWDGNNNSVDERNLSAAFGTGAAPAVRDEESMRQIGAWLRSPQNVPPPYPGPRDPALAAEGKALYETYCLGCHGKNWREASEQEREHGHDFTDSEKTTTVGTVVPIDEIRTDPCRLDNYTYALAVEQGNLYAAFPKDRFRHFRKTGGYASMPLDGIWLRGPYLHNGSVPTVRDLLNRADLRPAEFYRGGDVIDQANLGFVSDREVIDGVRLFRFETRCVDRANSGRCDDPKRNPENRHDDNVCRPGDWAGNSNRGHEYGTDLTDGQKSALVEYLKGF